MSEKVVIITGASSGIGKALAAVFAKPNNALVLGSRNIEKLKFVADKLKFKTPNILCVKTDVSQEADCQKLIESAVKKFGHIDVLINNAGISMRALFEEVELKVLKSLMDVNFWGMVYCTKYALPYLLKSKGSVVAVSSIAGYKGLPGRVGYSSSKFAMHGFMETLRIENRNKGLHVLIACPGFTTSNIRNTALDKDGIQQGESPRDEAKMMSADRTAQYIEKAIRKRKRKLILTTQGKIVVYMNKFFPKLIDKLVFNHMAKEPDSPFK